MLSKFSYYSSLLLSSFWFRPTLIALLAVPLSIFTLWIDVTSALPWLYESDILFRFSVQGARQILSVIIGSLITVTSLVFSMTVVALSITASQLGPRLIQIFSRGALPQVVLGSLLGNLVYGLLLLQEIGDPVTGVEYAPSLSLSLSIIGIIFNLILLVYFLHHTAQKIDADAVVATMGRDFESSVDASTSAGATKLPSRDYDAACKNLSDRNYSHHLTITANETGYIQTIDTNGLVRAATKENVAFDIDAKPGRFVVKGTKLAVAYADTAVDDAMADHVYQAVAIGGRRTYAQDLEFSVTALVEIALRALSPGINDPYTAITCIDRLASGLAVTLEAGLPTAAHSDGDGKVRVIISPATYIGLFNTAFNEIRQASGDKIAIILRLLEAASDLAQLAQSDEQKDAVARHGQNFIRLADAAECDDFDSEVLRQRVDLLRKQLDLSPQE